VEVLFSMMPAKAQPGPPRRFRGTGGGPEFETKQVEESASIIDDATRKRG
jgi:hypothetical protein